MDEARPDPEATLALRTIAMPSDTNPEGDIFGGWLLAQMDLAGGASAIKRSRGRVATVAIDGMTFHRPVFVGDEVTIYTTVVAVGRSSMQVRVAAWVCREIGGEPFRVTGGLFTFVAIDERGRPRPVDPCEVEKKS